MATAFGEAMKRPVFRALAAVPIGYGLPAHAQSDAGLDALSLGTGIGTALIILLAVVIGLSVIAKVLIFTGVVPREPTNRWEALAHAMADIVGRLRPHRSIRDRRRSGRF